MSPFLLDRKYPIDIINFNVFIKKMMLLLVLVISLSRVDSGYGRSLKHFLEGGSLTLRVFDLEAKELPNTNLSRTIKLTASRILYLAFDATSKL